MVLTSRFDSDHHMHVISPAFRHLSDKEIVTRFLSREGNYSNNLLSLYMWRESIKAVY